MPPPRTPGNPPGNMDNGIYEEVNESEQRGPFRHTYANPDQYGSTIECGEYSEQYDIIPSGHHDPNTFESQDETLDVNNQQDSYVSEQYIQVARDRQDGYEYSYEYQGLSYNGIVYVLCIHTQLFVF